MATVNLGRDIKTDELVTIDQEQRLTGLYVIGKTGSGKTTLLVNLVLQDIEQGMGVCFITPHADAITDILKRLPASRENDVILLDLLDTAYPFGLNLFQCDDPTDEEQVSRTISSVIEIFAKLFTESGDLIKEATYMTETLQNALPVLLAHQHPRMTMAELPLLVMNEAARTRLLAPLHNPLVRSYWESFNRWKADRQEEVTGSTRRRVGNFLNDPLIYRIVGQSETTIPFRSIMDERKILLVKLSRQHTLITSLVGSVIIADIAKAAFSREDTQEDERVQFNLYADEYQRFATPTFAELLTEVRKYKIATCVAHQARGQLDHANKVATLNAGALVVYQVSGDDAEELAKEFQALPPPAETRFEPASLVISQHPADDLVWHRHPNPRVQELVEAIFSGKQPDDPLVRAFNELLVPVLTGDLLPGSDSLIDRLLALFPGGPFAPASPPNELFAQSQDYNPKCPPSRQVILRDRYREAVNRSSIHLRLQSPRDMRRIPLGIAKALGLSPLEVTRREQGERERLRHLGWDDEGGYLSNEVQMTPIDLPLTQEEVVRVLAAMKEELDGLKDNEWQEPEPEARFLRAFSQPIGSPGVVASSWETWQYEWNQTTEACRAQNGKNRELRLRARAKLLYAHELCQELVKPENLIRVPSRQYVEKPFSQRSVADVEKEVAKQLANPPQAFAARCKLGTREHTIKALPFAEPDADVVWLARQERIVARTREQYCRPRKQVEEEIMARQRELTKPIERKRRIREEEEEE